MRRSSRSTGSATLGASRRPSRRSARSRRRRRSSPLLRPLLAPVLGALPRRERALRFEKLFLLDEHLRRAVLRKRARPPLVLNSFLFLEDPGGGGVRKSPPPPPLERVASRHEPQGPARNQPEVPD